MDIKKFSDTSSAEFSAIRDIIEKHESSTDSSEKNLKSDELLMNYIVEEVKENTERIETLENGNKPEKEYFKAAKFNIQISNLVFLILPFIQLIVTIIAIKYFDVGGTKFREFLGYLLAIIGLGTLAELIYFPFQIQKIKQRVDDLEE